MELLNYSSLNTSCTELCIFIKYYSGLLCAYLRVRTVRLCVRIERNLTANLSNSLAPLSSLSIGSANVHAGMLSTVVRRWLTPSRIVAAVIHSGRVYESEVVGVHFAAF